MVTLNDYLYSGDTMFKILKNYSQDLKKEAKCTGNEIDLMHANFLLSLIHISEPTRRTPISYAVFCLKKKKKEHTNLIND